MKIKNILKSLTILFVLFGLVLTASVFEEKVSANTYYFELFGGSPLTQDWTDTNQITVDDNWTNVLSIQGFRGDNLTTGIGVDPQTILVDGQATPLDVNANQTNPNTFNTGGVTEFEIANPTVALKGSATADAPHLMIYLDTTPCPVSKSISISYNVRDIDGSANNAVQQVALHYRIGTTGTFENVPAGYIADATEPNAATKVTSKLVNLPANIINRPQVELRIMTTNAAGTDEWVGIDDILVGCYFPTAATVSAGGRVLTTEGNGIARANVSILNTQSQVTQVTTTNPFGYFNFEGLEAGSIYIITIGHKSYTFSTHTQTIQLLADKKDFVFYADGQNNFVEKKRGRF